MGLNYEAAAKLFREGEFLQLIRASGHQEERHALEPRHRVILANALALVGELTAAQRLAEIDRHPTAPPSVRSQAELTLAMVSWRNGDLNSAVRLAQSAVHLAQESNEPERIAWAYLHLFRLLAEGGPIETVLGALPDVRRAVARAGVGQATDPSRVLWKLASWHNQPTEQLTTLRPYATFCHSLAKNEGNCLCPSILRS